MVPAVNAFARRSATIGSTHPAIGSHTSGGRPGASPNGSSTATGPRSLRRVMLSNRSSVLVSVTRAAPGASSSAGVSRSRVLPEPCGPITPAVRSHGHHNSPARGCRDVPIRQPTSLGSKRVMPGILPTEVGAARVRR